MALHRAVACDTDSCLALYVAVPQSGMDAALFAARRVGWDVSTSGLATRCPACRNGGPAVIERGNCPVCMGSTYDGRHGEVCHHCGHMTPHPADEDGDELAVVDEGQEHDVVHDQEDDGQLAAAVREGSAGR